jgi:hypothetical protein
MPPHKTVFTPTAIEIIRGLADQGKSAAEIADAIGSTPASIRVKCCQLKIKISKRGRPGSTRSRLPYVRERTAEQTLIFVPLQSATYTALKQKAAERHQSAIEMVGMLLEAIVGRNLYDAVLIDRGSRAPE